ncbi:MAG: 2Fe-2S iron-sulfur cluster binding domain-containing protein [Flavobacteriales bacterium]|nr:2Fe-2S iron-sulfur cluster binding domain-containing protein [Flavobacteriales bacterium]
MSTILPAIACMLFCLGLLAGFGRRSVRSRIHITINGGRVLEVSGGQSLFQKLNEHGVELPSSCGGKGSCAQCRCRVMRGGGRITDQERPYFTPAEVADNWRLACQVKVVGDLVVQLPGTDLGS